MQIPYNESNINNNYLNAYVKYKFSNDKLYFENTLYKTKVVVLCKEEKAKKLIAFLKQGIGTDKLIDFLMSISSGEDFYNLLLQNFIIE